MNSFSDFSFSTPTNCLTAQTAVECKLSGSGEFSRLLALTASVVPTTKEVLSGELRYGGKVLFLLTYEDSHGEVMRLERGAEFIHSIDQPSLTPEHRAKLKLDVKKTSLRRENGSLYLTAIVTPTAEIECPETIQFLTASDLIEKREEATLYQKITLSGMAETEDEFEAEDVVNVLNHSQQLLIEKVECLSGSVKIEGKISLLLTILKSDGISSIERLVPFSSELPCDEAVPFLPVHADGILRGVNVTMETDEEQGKTTLISDFTLEFTAFVCQKSTVELVADCYSFDREILLTRRELAFPVPKERTLFSEHVGGLCSVSETVDFSSEVECVTNVRASINESGEGVLTASVLLKTELGRRKVEIVCPFTLQRKGKADALVCGCRVRQKKEGELEAEAILKLAYLSFDEVKTNVITSIAEGKAWEKRPSSIQIFLPMKGDGLWECAKRLKVAPDEVTLLNPELQFPLSGEERILLYRKK